MDTSQLKQYRCHKVVRAAKIVSFIEPKSDQTVDLNSSYKLVLEGVAEPVPMPINWFAKHGPVAGGYLVVYDDSYASFSPAAAFEGGYTLVVLDRDD